MTDRPSHNLDGMAIDLARRIDEVCRRFEGDLREGRQPRIDDYLVDVPDEGRPALRSELEALERELRPSDDTVARPEAGPPAVPEPQTAPNPFTIAEAPTIAPGPLPITPILGVASSSVHEVATVPPSNPPRSALDEPTAAVLRQGPPATPGASEPTHIRYFGDYEIIREIARGGMGVVFRARQVSLNRTVALKMILAGQLADDIDVKRFLTEAEAAANLDHPGIVPIHEVGQHEGQHYFSMGFVEGQSLSQRLAEGPLPSREAAELIRRVSEAIEHAHHHGVIHRDLKPANILLDENGNPRVTDFGLAKKVQGDSGLTGSGQIMGTPSYMPPEQAGGKRGEVGPAADVYALGATFYALLTGRPPFQAATAMDTVIQVISDEPVPPRRLNASIPRDLETICLKCLEKGQSRRYPSAMGMADDLGRYLAGEPILARPVGLAERAVKWVRRRPVTAALSASVVVTGLRGLSGIIWQWREAQAQARIARGNERAAIAARSDAQDQAKIARDEAEFANRRLYDVKMNVVQRAWEDWDPTLFLGSLDEQRPEHQRGVERRGFEWYYWRRKLASGHRTFKGHTGAVLSVAFSPDGSRLASASLDKTMKAWNLATGQETLTATPGVAYSVAFSPDGSRIAAACVDGTVKVFDLATGRETLTLKGHTGSVLGVAFSPDGRRLASAGGQFKKPGEVKVWDAGTGKEILALKGHTNAGMGVAFSPDGKRLASSERTDGTVKVWDAGTGQETLTLKGHTDGVRIVAFSPDGQRLASAGSDSTVRMWNVVTGQETLTLKGHTGSVESLAFSPDGKLIASAGDDSTVKVWVAATGQEIRTLKAHTIAVTSVAFSPDGQRLASASHDHTVKVWDAPAGQEPLTLMGHDGRVSSGVRFYQVVYDGAVNSVAFSPDGQQLAAASGDRTVKVWDAGTGQEIRTLKGHTDVVQSVAFSRDGSRLGSASFDGTVKVWDVGTGQATLTLTGHSGFVMGVAFSPDGQQLASAGADGKVKVWDAATGRENRTLNKSRGTSVAFSPDGQRIAAAGEDGTVKVWDAATGREILTLSGGGSLPQGLCSVAFSPDGSRIACAGLNGMVKVWDAATGGEPLTFTGHKGQVFGVAFSPDGKRLASAGNDETVKVWDAATGQETLTLKGHKSWVSGVAFSPDGGRIASASADKTLKVWDARPLDAEPAKPGPGQR